MEGVILVLLIIIKSNQNNIVVIKVFTMIKLHVYKWQIQYHIKIVYNLI